MCCAPIINIDFLCKTITTVLKSISGHIFVIFINAAEKYEDRNYSNILVMLVIKILSAS